MTVMPVGHAQLAHVLPHSLFSLFFPWVASLDCMLYLDKLESLFVDTLCFQACITRQAADCRFWQGILATINGYAPAWLLPALHSEDVIRCCRVPE